MCRLTLLLVHGSRVIVLAHVNVLLYPTSGCIGIGLWRLGYHCQRFCGRLGEGRTQTPWCAAACRHTCRQALLLLHGSSVSVRVCVNTCYTPPAGASGSETSDSRDSDTSSSASDLEKDEPISGTPQSIHMSLVCHCWFNNSVVEFN